jgi:hypothetical protein
MVDGTLDAGSRGADVELLSGLRLSTAKALPSRDQARVRTARRSGPRGAADFISTAASDTVVCTKHLLRIELATTRHRHHQRGERQRLRGLETHLCPPAGRLKATGSGRTPVPVSTQLGRGAAHSSSRPRRAIRCRASTGVQSTHRTPGPSRPDARPRSEPHEYSEHPLGLGPMLGPVRRPADGRLSRAPRAPSVAVDTGSLCFGCA